MYTAHNSLVDENQTDDDAKMDFETVDWSQLFDQSTNQIFKNWYTDDPTTAAMPAWSAHHETVSTSTTLSACTHFTYFDSTKGALKCTLPDMQFGDVRCMMLSSSVCYPVIITSTAGQKWTLNVSTPFLNLRYTRARKWEIC